MKYKPHKYWNEREIAFPEIKSFDQLFAKIDKKTDFILNPGNIVISSNVSIRDENKGFRWFDVKPSEYLIWWINEYMLYIEYDNITFEIIVHDPRNALVIARYGQIIGSRYIAYIDAKTIPAEVTA